MSANHEAAGPSKLDSLAPLAGSSAMPIAGAVGLIGLAFLQLRGAARQVGVSGGEVGPHRRVVSQHDGPTLRPTQGRGQGAEAGLLVVGASGHGGFVGMLLGSVTQHCVSHSACPVVVIRHSAPG